MHLEITKAPRNKKESHFECDSESVELKSCQGMKGIVDGLQEEKESLIICDWKPGMREGMNSGKQ